MPRPWRETHVPPVAGHTRSAPGGTHAFRPRESSTYFSKAHLREPHANPPASRGYSVRAQRDHGLRTRAQRHPQAPELGSDSGDALGWWPKVVKGPGELTSAKPWARGAYGSSRLDVSRSGQEMACHPMSVLLKPESRLAGAPRRADEPQRK